MVNRQLVSLSLLVCSLLPVTEPVCPAGTVRVDESPPVSGKSWCIRIYSADVTFCDAVKTCHAHGEEMISKPVYDAIKRYPGLHNLSDWWVGLTDALNERDKRKDGWIWMLDGQVTDSSGEDFHPIEPNNSNGHQDCVTTFAPSILLRDGTCTSTAKTLCFTPDPPVPGAPVVDARFATATIRNYTQPDPGCWIRASTGITNLFLCSAACFSLEFGDCIGFYWNFSRLECILLPYFDAAVPLSFANAFEMTQWRKFLRVR